MRAEERTMIGEERRERILLFLLARFQAPVWERGTPSYDEIAEAIGLSSKASVSKHLDRLRLDGLVEWKDRRPATLRLTERGFEKAKSLRLKKRRREQQRRR